MTPESQLDKLDSVQACRAQLEKDLLNAEATRGLRDGCAGQAPGPARDALLEVCTLLEGEWGDEPAGTPLEGKLDDVTHEALVIHPREKQERRHRWVSLFGRVLHLLDADEVVRTIARVTPKAITQTFPRLCRLTAQCARYLSVDEPAIHVAHGEERPFTVLVYEAPFLYIHQDFLGASSTGTEKNLVLSEAELWFAIAGQLQIVRGKHAALLQLSPERLEDLILKPVPFLVRLPLQLTSKAVGITRLNRATRWVGSWFQRKSRVRQVTEAVGDFLPDKDQDTVLPQVAHDWVRRWIQAVGFSADRAGLLACGSVVAAGSALLRLSPRFAPLRPEARVHGVRWLLQEHADADRAAAERLQELIRFGLSEPYLAFLTQGTGAVAARTTFT